MDTVPSKRHRQRLLQRPRLELYYDSLDLQVDYDYMVFTVFFCICTDVPASLGEPGFFDPVQLKPVVLLEFVEIFSFINV